ncbi:MAG: hypothetical protein FKY71_09940 [Spiribacter salinus]|uniref:Uncharacterized protein n=1 Tax=Spiribacter salinus TaxID=1335746 RepID=A0A540VR08_9GAMM|nr:MAG: hypothetical protein FKY71_09940 [Spiribacter salinus]
MSRHDRTVWTVGGILHWRDWLVDNCPHDVLGQQARDALQKLPRERVSDYLKCVNNQFDSCGPLDFFKWAFTKVGFVREMDDWERHTFWDEANNEVADYLRAWYGDEDEVMHHVMRQHQ